MSIKFLLPLALLAAAADARAGDLIQSPASIEDSARHYVAASLGTDTDAEFSLGRLDPRLRLAQCEQPLAVRFAHEPGSGGANPVAVRCDGARPWSIYVSVTITRHADVVVATRALARGTIISAADVKLERRAVSAVRPESLTDPDQAVGQVVARPIAMAQTLGAGNVKLAHLIKRGDDVTLASVGGGISVRVRGKALADGALGDHISVRNANSSRVVEGVISAAGVVVVTGAAVL